MRDAADLTVGTGRRSQPSDSPTALVPQTHLRHVPRTHSLLLALRLSCCFRFSFRTLSPLSTLRLSRCSRFSDSLVALGSQTFFLLSFLRLSRRSDSLSSLGLSCCSRPLFLWLPRPSDPLTSTSREKGKANNHIPVPRDSAQNIRRQRRETGRRRNTVSLRFSWGPRSRPCGQVVLCPHLVDVCQTRYLDDAMLPRTVVARHLFHDQVQHLI